MTTTNAHGELGPRPGHGYDIDATELDDAGEVVVMACTCGRQFRRGGRLRSSGAVARALTEHAT